MERAEKREFVTELNESFKGAGSVVVAHYAGVTVAQMNDFRSKMRAAGGTVKVAKNRLAKIARVLHLPPGTLSAPAQTRTFTEPQPRHWEGHG